MKTNANQMPEIADQVIVTNPFDGKSYNFFWFFQFLNQYHNDDMTHLMGNQYDAAKFTALNFDYKEVEGLELQNTLHHMFTLNDALETLIEVKKDWKWKQ